MKNEKKTRVRQANSKLTVTATIDEQLFLEELVKHLAEGHMDKGYCEEKVQLGWVAVDTTSIEAYVSGNIILSESGEPLRLAYTTSFLFTCAKEYKQDYALEGSFSMS
jgi:hypothetical protein